MWRTLCFLSFLIGMIDLSSVEAGSFYWEFGLGLSSLHKTQAFFKSTPNATHTGFGVNATFFKNLVKDTSFIQPHLGVRTRFYSAGADDRTLNLITPSLMLRIEVFHIYFGGGVGFASFKAAGNGQSIFDLGLDSNSFFGGELGAVWHVIPDFSIALELGNERLHDQASVYMACIQMRFYFGDGITKREGYERKVDGWRYPFGIPLF